MNEVKSRPVRPIDKTEHLVPQANRLLGMAGKMAWGMVKLMGWIAVRIPGWFIRANRRNIGRIQKEKSARS